MVPDKSRALAGFRELHATLVITLDHYFSIMGLRMDDIHTPTVPSGPTTGQRAVNGIDKDKLSLMDLIAEKTRVEEELSALGSVLDSVLR